MLIRNSLKSLILSGLLFTVAGQGQAQDAALYDAPPPPDATFIRFAVATDHYGDFDLADERGDAGDYNVFIAGTVADADVGKFYTALPDGTLIAEPDVPAQKVQIGVINLSGNPVGLTTGDGSVEIIPPVAEDAAGWRLVNPIAVSVRLSADGNGIGDAYDLVLRRGENPTFIVDTDGNVRLLKSTVLSGIVE